MSHVTRMSHKGTGGSNGTAVSTKAAAPPMTSARSHASTE